MKLHTRDTKRLQTCPHNDLNHFEDPDS
jgi:hypothetical protein